MHGYWSDVRRLWWSKFKKRFEAWQLYAGLVATIAILFFGPNLYAEFETYQKRWWAVLLPLVWSALSALKYVLEEHYDALHRDYVKLGDHHNPRGSARRQDATGSAARQGLRRPRNSEHCSAQASNCITRLPGRT